MATLDKLGETLAAAGKPVETLSGPDGARILVLPYGGRVLGLFAPGGDENFLWTHPALENAESARALYSSPSWHNSGGDRTWLAPEVDFFFPRYPDTSVYLQPRQLDPGQYRVERCGASLRLDNHLTLRSSRTGEELDLHVSRSVEAVASPLHQYRSLAGMKAVRFAGYSLRSTLELTGGIPQVTVGLWNLLQMPHGGRMLVPTHARTEPTVCFGRIDARDLVAEERLVQWDMRAVGVAKIGMGVCAITGRAGYLYPSGPEWALVVRNFSVDPSGTYVDCLWTAPERTGWAFQACSVSTETLGNFSELEYHVPGIGGMTGCSRCEDTSEVWAFRGAASAIRTLAGLLLGDQAE